MKCAPLAFATNTGNSPAPFLHPVHGHAAKRGLLGALVQLTATRVRRNESLGLAFLQLLQVFPIHCCHASVRAQLAPCRPFRQRCAALAAEVARSNPLSQFVDHFFGRVRPGSACQSIARMRAIAAEEQPFHRRLVFRSIVFAFSSSNRPPPGQTGWSVSVPWAASTTARSAYMAGPSEAICERRRRTFLP